MSKQIKQKIAKLEQEIKDLKLKRRRARKQENRWKLDDKIYCKYGAIENLEFIISIIESKYKHPQNKKMEKQ